MPRISEATRLKRRAHILDSAVACFALNGFQATSMDDVVKATGMSTSAVYRYFRSKDEIIEATIEEGLRRVRDMFVHMLAEQPTPDPQEVLRSIIDRFRELAREPRQDMARIAVQTWSEALRRPPLREYTEQLYNQALDHLTDLAIRWRDDGHLPRNADPRAAATTIFTLMQGVIVYRQFIDDVDATTLFRGISALSGVAVQPSAVATMAPTFRQATAG